MFTRSITYLIAIILLSTAAWAGSLGDTWENKVLDHLFKNTALTQPTNLYVGLTTTAPTDAAAGTEVTGGSYARVNHNTWNVAASGSLTNNGVITYTTATANWGTVTHVEIWDCLSCTTLANRIAWGALSVNKAVNNGETAKFLDASITVTAD